MSSKKKIIIRISILIVVITTLIGFCNESYGGILMTLGAVGIGNVIVWGIQLLVLSVGVAGNSIIGILTAAGTGTNSTVTGIKSIFFNQNSLTTASFFANKNNKLGLSDDAFAGGLLGKGPMYQITVAVSDYYNIMRSIAIAILLFILLYIGIRMAISTVASEDAKYKKMFGNWIVSLAIVYVLHFIMIITFYINNVLVSTLSTFADDVTAGDYLKLFLEGLVPVAGFGEALVYTVMVGLEITFLLMYVKRFVTLAFLIVIAPLITITYSVDKIADNRSQALNTWMKEFIFTVLIQPFHCILYIVLVQTTLKGMADIEGLGGWIIYIIVLQFVKEAEKIIKKIFNIHSESLPDAISMGAFAMGSLTQMGKLGGKAANIRKKGKEIPKMKDAAGNSSEGTSTSSPSGGTSTSTTTPSSGGTSTSGSSTTPSLDGTRTSATTPSSDGTSTSGSTTTPSSDGASISGSTTTPSGETVAERVIKGWNATGNFFFGDRFKEWDSEKKVIQNVGSVMLQGAKKYGGAVAAFGVGLGMSDVKGAMGFGTTGSAISDKITGAIQEHQDNVLVEENEDLYMDKYDEYAEKIKAEILAKKGIAMDDDAVEKHILELMKMEQDGSLTDRYSDYYDADKEFISGVYTDMFTTYDYSGVDKPDEMVNLLTRKAKNRHQRRMYENNN